MLSQLIEFRPNNKVYFSDNGQIVTVYIERINFTVDEKLFNTEYQEVQIWGVPLTDEIVEKNLGFIKYVTPKYEYWEIEGFKLWKDKQFYHKNSETVTYFENLHRLQNYYYAVFYKELKVKDLIS